AEIPAPDRRHYRNVDYQFSVDLPRGFPACVDEETNHGVGIYLNKTATCADRNIEQVPHIDVFASYNTPEPEARTPARLAYRYCRPSPPFDPAPLRVAWLRRPMLGGRPAAGCREYFEGGRVAVLILTLRKTPGAVSGWIEVGAYLETTAARYEHDMRAFRGVLKTVWIHPDGPQD
ncbi:MAG: hypothetical protein ACREDY_24885, partial [Bradyrhizobium sp.]